MAEPKRRGLLDDLEEIGKILEDAGYGERLAQLEASPPSFSPGVLRRGEELEKRLAEVNKRLDITAATPKKQRGKKGLLED